jgi:hypothetical protein
MCSGLGDDGWSELESAERDSAGGKEIEKVRRGQIYRDEAENLERVWEMVKYSMGFEFLKTLVVFQVAREQVDDLEGF